MSVWLEPETVAALGETQMTDTPNGLEQAIEAGFSTSDGAYGLFSKADIRALLAQNRRYAEALAPFIEAAQHGVAVAEAVKAANLPKQGLSPLMCPDIPAGVHAAESRISFADWKRVAALNPIGGSLNG